MSITSQCSATHSTTPKKSTTEIGIFRHSDITGKLIVTSRRYFTASRATNVSLLARDANHAAHQRRGAFTPACFHQGSTNPGGALTSRTTLAAPCVIDRYKPDATPIIPLTSDVQCLRQHVSFQWQGLARTRFLHTPRNSAWHTDTREHRARNVAGHIYGGVGAWLPGHAGLKQAADLKGMAGPCCSDGAAGSEWAFWCSAHFWTWRSFFVAFHGLGLYAPITT